MHWIDGEVVFTRIPRDIVSPGIVAYLYYIPYSHNENLLFLYNDSKKNIEQSFESKPHNSIVQKSEVCVITVSKDGKLKREMLLNENEKSIALFSRAWATGEKSFTFLLEKLNFASMSTNKYRLIKVDVE